MMGSWYERQSLGSSPGVRHGTGEPGTASAERASGGGEPNYAGALASPAAPVGSGATHACRDRQATRAQSSGEGSLRSQTDTILAWYRGSSPASSMVRNPVAIL